MRGPLPTGDRRLANHSSDLPSWDASAAASPNVSAAKPPRAVETRSYTPRTERAIAIICFSDSVSSSVFDIQ